MKEGRGEVDVEVELVLAVKSLVRPLVSIPVHTFSCGFKRKMETRMRAPEEEVTVAGRRSEGRWKIRRQT
ncbi:hypothetical protein L6452_02717 [Arctium lappa]|uniref:Uncharacterized protein n=1 Tax=Arctium lappa TaxID=4217 RepID=A0ACB9FLU7_ARCLA|nr:hypothetical protein L6452_02717 [Arctium lappa]